MRNTYIIFESEVYMFEQKTLVVEMIVNIETEKYKDMNQLMKKIKDEFEIEQLILSDKEIHIDNFSVERVKFFD